MQFTEILLTYYLCYKKFPSEVVKKCVVTPLQQLNDNQMILPESEIPILDTDNNTNNPDSNYGIDSVREEPLSKFKLVPNH